MATVPPAPAHRSPRLAATHPLPASPCWGLAHLRFTPLVRASRVGTGDRGCGAVRFWGFIADSLIPVHAWSHNVSDVVAVAAALEATGHFEVVTPTALLRAVAQNVPPTE